MIIAIARKMYLNLHERSISEDLYVYALTFNKCNHIEFPKGLDIL